MPHAAERGIPFTPLTRIAAVTSMFALAFLILNYTPISIRIAIGIAAVVVACFLALENPCFVAMAAFEGTPSPQR